MRRRDFLYTHRRRTRGRAVCARRGADLAGRGRPLQDVRAGRIAAVMQKMFDQLGGLGRLVKGKTVAMKINLTGVADVPGRVPAARGHALHAPARDRARRATDDEGRRAPRAHAGEPVVDGGPVEEYILRANWEPRDILGAAPNVEFENTNYLGRAKKYSRMTVPYGG